MRIVESLWFSYFFSYGKGYRGDANFLYILPSLTNFECLHRAGFQRAKLKVNIVLGVKSLVKDLLSPHTRINSSYLVDPASSHMLVSKIKPCMSKYKQLCTVKLRMAH